MWWEYKIQDTRKCSHYESCVLLTLGNKNFKVNERLCTKVLMCINLFCITPQPLSFLKLKVLPVIKYNHKNFVSW